MKSQLQSMSGTLLGTCCKTTVQNKFQVPYHEMSATVNKCQASYLEMLGTYPIVGVHETVRY